MKLTLGDSRVRTDGFERHEYMVNGTRTVLYSAGRGDPLVYFHGAGTFHGFDYVRDWTDRFRVFVPYHPGFGESEDNPRIDSMHDYVLHYVDLFDQMGLQKLNLVGCSMGGRMAAEFAIEHGHRLEKLVLVCPAGLDVPEHPTINLSAIPEAELFDYLIKDVEAIRRFLPAGPDPQFGAMRAREGAAVGRILQNGSLVNPKISSWLHRVHVPTLLLWGNEDRIIPVEQAETWATLLPKSTIRIVNNAGHLILDESAQGRAAVKEYLVDSTAGQQAEV
jgi:pimeloyl-ACP methyl ester carboxylesterase